MRDDSACADRVRRLHRLTDSLAAAEDVASAAPPRPGDDDSPFSKERSKSWARLLRKIPEVEPLLCPRGRVELRVVSVITDAQEFKQVMAGLEARPPRFIELIIVTKEGAYRVQLAIPPGHS